MTKKRIKELEERVRDARIAELEAQLAEAKLDSERLNWLERNVRAAFCEWLCGKRKP